MDREVAYVMPSNSGTVPLQLVQLHLDPQRLFAFCGATGVTVPRAQDRQADYGYIVHAILAAQFGPLMPKPFYLVEPSRLPQRDDQPMRRGIVVLGYCLADIAALREQASRANGQWQDVIDWDCSATRTMPVQFASGRRLAFAVRVCPVVRTVKRRTNREAPSVEVDAFLSAAESAAPHAAHSIDRATVYREWLLPKLHCAGAVVDTIQMSGFRLSAIARRNGSRTLRPLTRPAAEFEGVLQVSDPVRFASLIARGVGRHRAFGFGMLRLAPAG